MVLTLSGRATPPRPDRIKLIQLLHDSLISLVVRASHEIIQVLSFAVYLIHYVGLVSVMLLSRILLLLLPSKIELGMEQGLDIIHIHLNQGFIKVLYQQSIDAFTFSFRFGFFHDQVI